MQKCNVGTVARKENVYFFGGDLVPIEFLSYLETSKAHLRPLLLKLIFKPLLQSQYFQSPFKNRGAKIEILILLKFIKE